MKTLFTALIATVLTTSAFAETGSSKNHMSYTATIAQSVSIDEAHIDLYKYIGGGFRITPDQKEIILFPAPCPAMMFCTMEYIAPKKFEITAETKNLDGVVTYEAREFVRGEYDLNTTIPMLTITDFSRTQNLATVYMADTVLEYTTSRMAKGSRPVTMTSVMTGTRLESIR